MELDDEFRKSLDRFIEAMRDQHDRSSGFRELVAFLRANIDTLTADQEAAVADVPVVLDDIVAVCQLTKFDLRFPLLGDNPLTTLGRGRKPWQVRAAQCCY
ncbi:hypothetical protein GGE16_003518 [Rhizobium leguminosarum]|uniref:Uncharacterized protein n=1 Tax=Rhizobium leguminosarum TaxID=384 RepID=A0AAE2MLK8_RHILE|nr:MULTISPECIES: hypothetical protein [Rhizobium]MBB4291459.1 hypothetical protein [Rhizobium leguminosarum]MBB4296156.1 hypothetical protein [Rhizobium leguminosarum]MBB4308585.1 hypothetical protein [Rhizobium leguminosarum]MBB4416420.1 hypothetical protein [Rhizobium leguminosarum]MBB4430613.1 hypothetical protein [Rhizobium esperanzae]